jgi:hypothetical protein
MEMGRGGGELGRGDAELGVKERAFLFFPHSIHSSTHYTANITLL